MMASLPQTPAQSGLASILAALGQAAPAGTATDAPGFEQLFASLPAATPAAANLLGAQTPAQPGAPDAAQIVLPSLNVEAVAVQPTPAPPAAALFGLPQPIGEDPADADASAAPVVKAPAVRTNSSSANEAAAAASLLIAVATPLKGATPATDKPVAQDNAETSADSEPAAPVALPVATIVEAPVAAAVVATAMPTSDKPVGEKTSKPATPAAVRRQADPALPTPATTKIAEAVQPQPTAGAVEAKAARPVIDAAASMTVLFAQPDLQGAATLGEAAKAVPVAERTLDLTSDDQWIAQLAADIAATKSDKGDISFRLMPRHLGRLDVSMLTGDEGVTLKLDTQHEATATIVSASQPRLVEDLRQQGVRVADTQVTHTPAEAGRQQQNQSQGRGTTPDTSHLIETAADQAEPTHDERTADRRGRFA